MRRSLVRLAKSAAVLGCAFAAASLAHAQGAATAGKTAEQAYKNIVVLKGTPADEVAQSMHLLRAALGVECEYCHEDPDRAADTKPPKQTARRMILMVNSINQTNFAGRPVVTCYTCHEGHRIPPTMPDLPVVYPQEPSAAGLPSVDQILAKFVESLGGEQALRKVTSRVITGTQYVPTGPGGTVPVPGAIERYQKAPNLIVNLYHTATYTMSDGFDGTNAWAQDQRGRVSDAVKVDQDRARRDSDFYFPLDIKKQYAKMEVEGIERVDGRDAYAIVATPQGDLPERLYFDMQTGLLLRKWAALHTPFGNSPSEISYSDYRDTGSGVKFPYLITLYPASTRSELATAATIRVTKVQDNAPIDDSKFAKPMPKPASAQ